MMYFAYFHQIPIAGKDARTFQLFAKRLPERRVAIYSHLFFHGLVERRFPRRMAAKEKRIMKVKFVAHRLTSPPTWSAWFQSRLCRVLSAPWHRRQVPPDWLVDRPTGALCSPRAA